MKSNSRLLFWDSSSSKANIKVRQPFAKITINQKLDEEYLNLLKDELNVKKLFSGENLNSIQISQMNFSLKEISENFCEVFRIFVKMPIFAE